jgi:hypothetical protein
MKFISLFVIEVKVMTAFPQRETLMAPFPSTGNPEPDILPGTSPSGPARAGTNVVILMEITISATPVVRAKPICLM